MKKAFYAELNCHYIAIKKCCASCQQRIVTIDGLRICRKHGKFVYKTNCCDCWRMNRKLNKSGARWGQMKNSDYLKFVARIRALENQRIEEAEAKGYPLAMLKNETIRRMYSKLYGEVFINF